MLSFMSNVVTLDLFIEYELWSLKGKLCELYMITRFMYII